ncbi:DNRLRE domain-containing protein [Streptomyces sp. NPDC020330]|uniref:DNRLRE domain-containing protein n=1 Tax=unclassified Streptomyces TaxID=2593676 RepID=UPI00379571AF
MQQGETVDWSTDVEPDLGNTDCTSSQPDGWINADVDALVQTWASAKATRGHMGLRAANDSTLAWKRVNSANNASNQPKLSVTYSYRPLDDTAQQAGPPFLSHNDVWGVNTLTPTLRDKFEDADGDLVSCTFQVFDAATNTPIRVAPNSSCLRCPSARPWSSTSSGPFAHAGPLLPALCDRE